MVTDADRLAFKETMTRNDFSVGNGDAGGVVDVAPDLTIVYGDKEKTLFKSDVINYEIDADYAIVRAVDMKKIKELKDRAELGEELGKDYDPDSHQKAAWDYGNYVGSEKVAGVARTISEFAYQFPLFTVEDSLSRIKDNLSLIHI